MARDAPPEVAASWPPPNFVNPETRGKGLLVLVCVLSFLTAMVLTLRIYVRVFFRQNFGVDDWMILPAMVFFQGLTAMNLLGLLRYGWGHHIWDLTLENRERAVLASWVAEILLTWCLTFTKLSLCFFYLRLLGGTNSSGSKRILHMLMGVSVVWGLVFTAAIVVQCRPIQAVFRINYPGEKCLNRQFGAIVHAGIDIVTDLFIYCLPLRTMWMLRVPRRRKALVVGLFMLGALVCTASILRLPATLNSMSDYDVTWYMWNSYIWTDLECGLGIIVACMPSLMPLLAQMIPSLAGGSLGQSPPRHYKFRGPMEKPLNLNAAHSYPMADISTTVMGVGDRDWCNESEEVILRTLEHRQVELGAITKTTMIEQTISGEDGSIRA